jgi:putative transcriptional regulator
VTVFLCIIYTSISVYFVIDLCLWKEMVFVPICYDKLFALMKRKRLSSYKIRKEGIISESTLTRIRKGDGVSTSAISALCKALECQPGDIMEYVPDV